LWLLVAIKRERWSIVYMEFTYHASIHDKGVNETFGENALVPEGLTPVRCVLLAFMKRSGSNYLAELLRSTGRFSGLDESLNSEIVKSVSAKFELKTFTDYLMHLHDAQGKRDTRQWGKQDKLWGMKVGWSQFALLHRTRAIPNLLAPTVILLRRRDIVSQAVSFHIGQQTQKWTSTFAPPQGSVDKSKVEYNGQEILNHLINIERNNEMLNLVFRVAGTPVHEITYEALLDQPASTIATLTGQILGHELTPRVDAVRIKVQRDELNETLKQQFLDEVGDVEWQARG
jgi:LPS sulfotransferase NodH